MLYLARKSLFCKALLVTASYRPSKSAIFKNFLTCVENEFDVLGDVNCNFRNNQPECHITRLESILQTFQLSQLIDEPTRITNETSSLIDLFLPNNIEKTLFNNFVVYYIKNDKKFFKS